MDPIIEALGVKSLPGPESEIIKKILVDPRVVSGVQTIVNRRFAAEAIQEMHPFVRADLAKRCGAVKSEAQRTRWHVAQTEFSGQWFIRASGRNQEVSFNGTPTRAATFRFMGEPVPPEILEEYRRVYRAIGFEQDGLQSGASIK